MKEEIENPENVVEYDMQKQWYMWYIKNLLCQLYKKKYCKQKF